MWADWMGSAPSSHMTADLAIPQGVKAFSLHSEKQYQSKHRLIAFLEPAGGLVDAMI